MLIALLAQISPSPTPQTTGGMGSLIIFLPLIALIFWMMRKSGRQRREHMDLVQSIQVGDEVETVAGMYGRVKRTSDDTLWVEMAPNVEFKMSRGAVRRRVTPDDGRS